MESTGIFLISFLAILSYASADKETIPLVKRGNYQYPVRYGPPQPKPIVRPIYGQGPHQVIRPAYQPPPYSHPVQPVPLPIGRVPIQNEQQLENTLEVLLDVLEGLLEKVPQPTTSAGQTTPATGTTGTSSGTTSVTTAATTSATTPGRVLTREQLTQLLNQLLNSGVQIDERTLQNLLDLIQKTP